MSLKNFNETIGNRTRDLPVCTEQNKRKDRWPCVMSIYQCKVMKNTLGKRILWNGACLLVLIFLLN